MNYGEFLRKIREYCIDKKIKNENLVNEPLEDFFDEAKLKKQKGVNKGMPFRYEYSECSRIINNKLEISPHIRDALRRYGMEEVIENSVKIFFEDNIDKSTVDDMVDDFMSWIDNSQVLMEKEISTIKSFSDDPGMFLAKIMVRSLKESNVKQNQEDSMIWSKGTGSIKIIKGDLFTYALGKRSKKTRIVVIPVNTYWKKEIIMISTAIIRFTFLLYFSSFFSRLIIFFATFPGNSFFACQQQICDRFSSLVCFHSVIHLILREDFLMKDPEWERNG